MAVYQATERKVPVKQSDWTPYWDLRVLSGELFWGRVTQPCEFSNPTKATGLRMQKIDQTQYHLLVPPIKACGCGQKLILVRVVSFNTRRIKLALADGSLPGSVERNFEVPMSAKPRDIRFAKDMKQ